MPIYGMGKSSIFVPQYKDDKEERNRRQAGITLIALVITIVILLILAGVSIAMLTGQNGILTKANEAKTATEQAEIAEKRNLTQAEAAMHLEKYEYIDSKGDKATIPAKFTVSQVEGENTIENGLVIISEKGNEFVWIPCTVEEYNIARISDWLKKQSGYTVTGKTWTDLQTTIGAESIAVYKGFYVARYEAGIPENATGIYANSDGETYETIEKNTTKYIPISRKNVQAWSNISQKNAKTISEKMEANSHLIDGNAWDMVCRKIASTEKKDLLNSTDWGNYYDHDKTNYSKLNILFAVHMYNNGWEIADKYQKGTPTVPEEKFLELATGVSEDTKAYNIYDIAGNMWEWTTETTNSENGDAVLRGGYFGSLGSEYPAVSADGHNSVEFCNIHFGFRTVLYL